MWLSQYLYFHSYLLTYCIQHSPSWEANLFSASQENPHILWDPKVRYSSLKGLPILGEFDSYFFYALEITHYSI